MQLGRWAAAPDRPAEGACGRKAWREANRRQLAAAAPSTSSGSSAEGPCSGYLGFRGLRTLACEVRHVPCLRPSCRPTAQAARNVQLRAMAPVRRTRLPKEPAISSEHTCGRVAGRLRGWGPWRLASPPCSTLPTRALEDCIFPATPTSGRCGGTSWALRQECLSHATGPATTTTPLLSWPGHPKVASQETPSMLHCKNTK